MNIAHKHAGLSFLMVMLMAVVMVAAGCHEAPGRSKKFGTYYEYMPGSVEHVSEAAHQVMGEMGYLSKTDANSVGRLSYRTSFGSDINVKIEADGPSSVRVGVNVNPGDSEGLSQNILKKIRERASGTR